MTGFITIERKLWDHPIFAPSPMSEREAWVWMISRAAWSDTEHFVGGEMRPVPRGSFMVTLREMQSAFMWGSDKKVRNFLKKLECHGMIAAQSLGARNARKTHVTIRNYNEYQSSGRSKDAPSNETKVLSFNCPSTVLTRRTEGADNVGENGGADANGTHHGRTTDAVKNKVTKEQQEKKEREAIASLRDLDEAAANSEIEIGEADPVEAKPKPKTKTKPKPAINPQDFLDFWEAYPHRDGKKGKANSQRHFNNAIKSGVTVEQIAAGIENMQKDPMVQRGFTRDPATWLYGRGWEDEFETKPFTAINGGLNERSNNNTQNDQRGGLTKGQERSNATLENIARLAQLR